MIEKNHRRGGNTPLTFVEILNDMNQEGGFSRSVLATSEGLPIASAPVNPDSELASAMVAVLQQAASETRNQFQLPPIDEFTIRAVNKHHLICRMIKIDSDMMILGVVVPPGQLYRRVTNKAITRIREAL
ncbi:MAG: roadblock/LC7 domain-containing protein [Anaerolineales bacterium]|nr:roadblock/LC7 domain-containing protein [Anaerolineales bacterium]